MIGRMIETVPLLLWAGLWIPGGWLIATFVFRVARRERVMVGLALGLVLQAWFSNILARILPVPASFWGGALVTLLLGLGLVWPLAPGKIRRGLSVPLGQLTALALLAYLFMAIGRGLNIFDDYQNLPTISLMATGEIPPRFALSPDLSFDYHYLLLLIAAQIMRLGDVFPWNALDFVRAVTFGLNLLLIGLWVLRMTRSRLAATLGVFFAAFAGGARWLLLLLPPSLVEAISEQVTLIGSAAQTDPSLARSLLLPWQIEGHGPIPFPFAYTNGLISPMIMTHGGTGLLPGVLAMLMLMLYRRWRDWRGTLVITILLAAFALVSENGYLGALLGLGVALVVYWIMKHSLRLPRSLFPWLAAGLASAILAALQGGVLTGVAREWLGRLTGEAGPASYFAIQFVVDWPPSIISGHLGELALTDARTLAVALFELGPLILVLPLVVLWGLKMLRAERWWEAGLAAGLSIGVMALFVKYSGTAGISANSRLLGMLTGPAALYALPLAWIWARRRSEHVKIISLSLGLLTVFGGMLLFGIELIAAQKPQLPTFIHEMDARMAKRYWNTLEPDALIFDPYPTRAVTVFGRYTDSNETWYVPKSEWEALYEAPDPHRLHDAGFDYLYFGIEYWEYIDPPDQAALQDACVRLVDEATGIRSEDDYRKDFRRLLDIRACE